MKFDQKRMKKLVARDGYLKFVYRDYKSRNPKASEEHILKILFNANVADSSDYTHLY